MVSTLHNIAHVVRNRRLGYGAHRSKPAITWFGGAIYLALFLCRLIVGQESAANFVPVNTDDDVPHLILGIGMVGLGLALTRDRMGVGGATS